MRSKYRIRQACHVTESGSSIGVVLASAADARAVQVVVLTLYEMECVKPLNPTYNTMVIFSHSRDFPLCFWWFIFNFGCIPRTSCCVRIVLYFVVLTLYEIECVKPLDPTVRWLFLAISDIFLFVSDDSSLSLVAYLVHSVLRRDIRSRKRSSINCTDTTELSTVRYLLPGLQNRVQKYPLFRSSSSRYCCW